jgi:putative copper export protein
MLTAVGVGAFALVVYDRPGAVREVMALRQLTLAAALVAVVASVAGLGIEIASISGQGLAGATNADAAAIVARNGFCAGVLLRVIGLGLFALAVYYEADVWTAWLFGILGAALICASCALTGHEATHGFAVRFAVSLHVLAASIWAGGLVALGVTLRARRRASDLVGAAVVVRRFSIVMSSTVAVLITAGIVLTCLVLGSPGRLLTTDYGLVLSAKIALATTVVAVAAFNQRRLVPAVVAQSTRGWTLLARTVLVEQAALLVVVALTAVLVNLDPGS